LVGYAFAALGRREAEEAAQAKEAVTRLLEVQEAAAAAERQAAALSVESEAMRIEAEERITLAEAKVTQASRQSEVGGPSSPSLVSPAPMLFVGASFRVTEGNPLRVGKNPPLQRSLLGAFSITVVTKCLSDAAPRASHLPLTIANSIRIGTGLSRDTLSYLSGGFESRKAPAPVSRSFSLEDLGISLSPQRRASETDMTVTAPASPASKAAVDGSWSYPEASQLGKLTVHTFTGSRDSEALLLSCYVNGHCVGEARLDEGVFNSLVKDGNPLLVVGEAADRSGEKWILDGAISAILVHESCLAARSVKKLSIDLLAASEQWGS